MNVFSGEFSRRIREAGVVGAGGAGFPSYVKASSRADTVILNAAECEPLLQKDREILLNFTTEVIAGLELLMRSVNAKEAIIGIKAKHSSLIRKIEPALTGRKNIRIHRLDDFYPAGDEFCLVYETTGKIIPQGEIPLKIGVVVNNVETVYNMFMSGKTPVTDTFFTVTGAVKKPATMRFPIGASFEDAVNLAGGAACENCAVIDGGAMMGKVVTDFDTPATKTTGGLIVLPKNHPLVVKKAAGYETYSKTGKSACDQCSQCTELCPRYLLGYEIQPHKVMRSLLFSRQDRKTWNEWALLCSECSLCSLYSCPEGLDPRNICISAKSELGEAEISLKNSSLSRKGSPCEQGSPSPKAEGIGVHPVREYRKVPVSKLIQHLGLEDYKAEAPLIDTGFVPKKVRIMLQQHIGAPAGPVVKEGQKIKKGGMVGDVPSDKLGVPVHASISGTVTKVTAQYVEITGDVV